MKKHIKKIDLCCQTSTNTHNLLTICNPVLKHIKVREQKSIDFCSVTFQTFEDIAINGKTVLL